MTHVQTGLSETQLAALRELKGQPVKLFRRNDYFTGKFGAIEEGGLKNPGLWIRLNDSRQYDYAGKWMSSAQLDRLPVAGFTNFERLPKAVEPVVRD